jgi:hypothetical protein
MSLTVQQRPLVYATTESPLKDVKRKSGLFENDENRNPRVNDTQQLSPCSHQKWLSGLPESDTNLPSNKNDSSNKPSPFSDLQRKSRLSELETDPPPNKKNSSNSPMTVLKRTLDFSEPDTNQPANKDESSGSPMTVLKRSLNFTEPDTNPPAKETKPVGSPMTQLKRSVGISELELETDPPSDSPMACIKRSAGIIEPPVSSAKRKLDFSGSDTSLVPILRIDDRPTPYVSGKTLQRRVSFGSHTDIAKISITNRMERSKSAGSLLETPKKGAVAKQAEPVTEQVPTKTEPAAQVKEQAPIKIEQVAQVKETETFEAPKAVVKEKRRGSLIGVCFRGACTCVKFCLMSILKVVGAILWLAK